MYIRTVLPAKDAEKLLSRYLYCCWFCWQYPCSIIERESVSVAWASVSEVSCSMSACVRNRLPVGGGICRWLQVVPWVILLPLGPGVCVRGTVTGCRAAQFLNEMRHRLSHCSLNRVFYRLLYARRVPLWLHRLLEIRWDVRSVAGAGGIVRPVAVRRPSLPHL